MDDHLVRRLRARLAAEGLSLRGLARRAGVSHSTLSRLLAGRSHATPHLLRAVAVALDIPPEELLAGDDQGPAESETVWGILREMGMDPAPTELVARVREGLIRLREYAATDEGRALVRDGLERKVIALGARGPVIERLRSLAHLYLHADQIPEAARLSAGSAALYFLNAVDAIDDFMWPIGYIDDAVAVALAEAEVRGTLAGQAPR